MKNKLLIAFFIIIVILFGGVFYINRIFIPVHFKKIVIQESQKYLQRNISLENLHFSLFSGLSIDELNIYQKDDPEKLLMHFDQATVGVNLFSVLMNKKYIIPSIELTNPIINVSRDENKKWNFQDLLPLDDKSKSDNKESLPNIIIERLTISKGIIEFHDEGITPHLKEKIIIKNLRSSLSLRSGANFDADIFFPNIESNLKTEGSYNPFNKKGSIKINSQNFPLARYWPYLNQENMMLRNGIVKSLDIITNIDNKKIDITGNVELDRLSFSQENNTLIGNIQFNNFVFQWHEGLNDLKGHLIWNDAEIELMDKFNFDGAINAVIQTAGFNNDFQFFKGSFNINDIIFSDKNIGSFTGNVSSKNFSYNSKEQKISVLGNLTLTKPDIKINSGNIIAESITIPTLDIQHNINETIVNSNIEMTDALIGLSNNQSIKGDLAWSDGKFILDRQENVHIEGDLKMRQGHIIVNPSQSLKGNLTLTHLDANIKKENVINANFKSLDFFESDIVINENQLKGNITALNNSLSIKDNTIKYNGDTAINNAHININSQNINGNIVLNKLNLIIDSQNQLSIKTDALMEKFQIALDDQKEFLGNIRADNTSLVFNYPKISLNSNIKLTQTQIKYDQYTFNGEPIIDINYDGNLNTILDGDYSGNITLKGSQITGIPHINSINNIVTSIALTKNNAIFNNLSFLTLGTPVSLNGNISDFKSLKADLIFKTEIIDLLTAKPLIKDQLEKQQLDILSGKTKISGSYKGSIQDFLSGIINADVTLDNIGLYSIQHEKTLTELNGSVNIKNNAMALNNVTGLVDGRNLSVTGTIADFKKPTINMALNIDGMIDANIQTVKNNDTLQINALKIKAYDSHVNANGSILINEKQPPYINLALQSTIETKDIVKLAPWLKDKIEPLNLKGTLISTGSIKGYTNNWKMFDSNINIKTPFFSALGYKATNLDIRINQTNGLIDPIKVNANAYEGIIETYSTINLNQENFPFDSSAKINRVDIAKFIKDFPSLRTNDVAGWLSGQASLKGELTNILPTLNGNGSVEIIEGYLREIKVFKGMLSILNPILELDQDIVITEAKTNFKLGDKKILIENGVLSGSTMGFKANGWIAMDKSLDLSIDPDINAVKLSRDGSRKSIPLDISLPSVRIFGTISDPQYDYDISAGKMIEKTLQNTVGTLIEGLFN